MVSPASSKLQNFIRCGSKSCILDGLSVKYDKNFRISLAFVFSGLCCILDGHAYSSPTCLFVGFVLKENSFSYVHHFLIVRSSFSLRDLCEDEASEPTFAVLGVASQRLALSSLTAELFRQFT